MVILYLIDIAGAVGAVVIAGNLIMIGEVRQAMVSMGVAVALMILAVGNEEDRRRAKEEEEKGGGGGR